MSALTRKLWISFETCPTLNMPPRSLLITLWLVSALTTFLVWLSDWIQTASRMWSTTRRIRLG